MVLLCKQNALYVKCCIIANGITDSQGDTLYAEDIKKIFTSFNNQDNFEIYHNDIPIQEVSLLENYISSTDETLGTSIIPRGSWNAVIRVDNPEIKQGLLTGEFGGVSLNNRIAEKCRANLTGQVRYQDIADAECVIPLLISFVERGANGYGLHVMDYDAYIKKSKTVKDNGAKKMEFKEFLDGVKALIKKAEDTSEEEPKKEEEAPIEEEKEEPVVEKEDEKETTEEEPTVEKEEAVEEEEEKEETEITKEDEEAVESEEVSLEERVAKLEEAIAKLLGEEETELEPAEEPVDEDTPKITKSEKVIVESKTITNNNYYEMTNRDPLTGMKIRKTSKLL